MVSESKHNHTWSFTPGVSLFVECETEEDIDAIFEKLASTDGQIMGPLDHYDAKRDYGFGKKCG